MYMYIYIFYTTSLPLSNRVMRSSVILSCHYTNYTYTQLVNEERKIIGED